MKPISKVAKAIAPSATLAIDSLAKQMKADGIDVIGFGAGEPDFNTPDHIKAAGIKAINDNQTRYTPASGVMPLKKAICERLKADIGVEYDASQICCTSGAKHSVYITLMALCNPGDEVILPAPYWVTYEESVKMAGAVPVIVNTTEETNFKITAGMLQNAITPNTKCLILNNPSNPTGMLYTEAELRELADVIVKNDIYVMSDEIYYSLVYKGKFTSLASLGEEVKARTILVNGVSKAYAMTGWRIGYTAASRELTKAMSNYLSHSTGSPCTISQYASVEAIGGDQKATEEMTRAFDERRKYFMERVNKIDGVSCLEPEGAFYIFMNIKELFGKTIQGVKIESSADFAAALLEKALVAVVPGNAFGADGYLRWSYATSIENIKEGLYRLEKFLKG